MTFSNLNFCFLSVMEVGAAVVEPLQYLQTLSDKRFADILDCAFLGLLEETVPSMNDALDKIILASLATLIAESFSQNASVSYLISFLEERGMTADQKAIFKEKFDAVHSRLADHLRCLAPAPEPSVVDVDWKLNYLVRSNAKEKEDELSYLISLKTVDDSTESFETKDFKFTCTLHQLQDLVSKLREAYKNVERLGSITSV